MEVTSAQEQDLLATSFVEENDIIPNETGVGEKFVNASTCKENELNSFGQEVQSPVLRLEAEEGRGQIMELKDGKPISKSDLPLSLLVAKTLVTSAGLTARQIARQIIETYPPYSSMAISTLFRSVRQKLTKSKYYYKKNYSERKIPLWAVLPEHKSYLENIEFKSFRSRPPKCNKFMHGEIVEQKRSPESVSVDSLAACSELSADKLEENVMLNTDEGHISQFDCQKIDEFIPLAMDELPQHNSKMCVNEREYNPSKAESSNNYVNQNLNEEVTDLFELTNENWLQMEDVESIISGGTTNVESISAGFPTPASTTSSKRHSTDDLTGDVFVCPTCNLLLSAIEELSQHIQTNHTEMSNVDQSKNLKKAFTNLLTAFEKARAQPINIFIVTGNENVYTTPNRPKDT